ncbi:MAG: ribosome assembly RNA-binding protein YhbY [Betaproteobacteria bacterium]
MSELTPTQRRALRASAHRLYPVVLIGEAGLTPAVLKEIDLALKSHELIKIRVLHEDRERRRNWIEDICRALGCSPVQQIGKILIVHRPRPAKPEPADPVRKRTGKPKRRAKRSYQMQ